MSRLQLDLGLARGDLQLEWQLDLDCRWLGLYGASGLGKTTALELLLGWVRGEPGRALLDGRPLVGRGTSAAGEPLPVGYGPQDLLLLPHWTVAENLAAATDPGRGLQGELPPELRRRMLGALGLESLLQRSAGALSGGEGRRVALARAVLAAGGAGLLLLDEPLASLDRERRRLVLGFLLELARWRAQVGPAVAIVVSHSAVDLAVLCEQVQVLETEEEPGGGRRSRFGSPGTPAERLVDEGGYDNLLCGRVRSVGGDAAALDLDGGLELTIPGRGLEPGDRVVLGLRGDDVLVATEDPGAVSARNVLAGRVASASQRGAYVALGVELGPGLRIETHVTEGALRGLALEPGREVLLLFKTRSLELLARTPAS